MAIDLEINEKEIRDFLEVIEKEICDFLEGRASGPEYWKYVRGQSWHDINAKCPTWPIPPVPLRRKDIKTNTESTTGETSSGPVSET